MEPSRTLNSSEAICKGAALVAATKSPIFKVPKYEFKKTLNTGIMISWNLLKHRELGLESASYPEKQRAILYKVNAPME